MALKVGPASKLPSRQSVQAASRISLLVAFLRVAAVVGLLAYAALMHLVQLDLWRQLQYNDFGKFYYTVRLWQAGEPMYGPSPATLHPVGRGQTAQLWNMNPPHFHFLIWPLASLPIGTAAVLWTGANLLALGWAVRSIAKRIGMSWSVPGWIAVFVAAAATGPAMAWTVTGQLTGLLTALVTAAWLACRDERWIRAAAIVGFLCSIKPFLAPLWLWLVFRGQWRAAMLAIAVAVGAFASGLLVFGVAAHLAWLSALRAVNWGGAAMNASLYGLIGRTWTLGLVLHPPALLLSTLLAIAVLIWGTYRAAALRDADRSLLIIVTTALLASPLGWVYYVPILAGPALAVFSRATTRWPWYVAAACWMPPPFALWPPSSRLMAMTIGSSYAWGLLVMWAAAMFASPAFSPTRPGSRTRVH